MLKRVRDFVRRDTHLVGVQLTLTIALSATLTGAAAPLPRPEPQPERLARVSMGDISATGFAKLTAHMDRAMLVLASRFEPRPVAPAFGADLRAATTPVAATPEPTVLRLQDLTPDQARAWNAANPVAAAVVPAARPFHLVAGGMLDEARAVDCLTAAVYYEAAWESLDGQRAVAQVILNRMRHPAYPKTVCGVVFQGSNRTTGCQFTFTCDGSLSRNPNEAAWSRSRQVALAALNGYVMKKVGNATHYHASYVAPYWSPSLVKVGTIGAHIFYRWTGGWGQPPAFGGRYAGSETEGFQIAALDRLSNAGQVAVEGADAAPAVADVTVAEPVVAAKPAGASGADASSTEAAPRIVAVARVAEAAALIKAEDLDWTGEPKAKGPPRLAMPARASF